MDVLGRNAVMEYLRAMKPGEGPGAGLFISDGAHGKIIQSIINEASRVGLLVERRGKDFFSALGPSSSHQGVLLRTKEKARKDEGDYLQRAARAKGVIVFLDQLTDPHNVGSIIRSAEALGASGVVMLKSHAAPLTPTVVKSSAGATAHIPVIEETNAARFLDRARDEGFWVLGSAGEGEDMPSTLGEFRPAVLVIGSEGSGMRRSTAEKCDRVVRIPLRGKVGSLNASVAAGILLYELLKE